jgi:ribosomal protein S6--L-glutamate ligase
VRGGVPPAPAGGSDGTGRRTVGRTPARAGSEYRARVRARTQNGPDPPMKLAILSRNASLYSTSRLKEAAAERGHEVRIIDYLRCVMDITSHRPAIMYGGTRLEDFDAIIHTFYGTAVVRQFEMMGVYPTNESQGISRSRDKLRSMQLLAREGVGLPVTSFAHSTKDVDGLIDLVGGAPLVVKLLEGTQGMGVVLAETKKAAESVIGAFRQLNANILVQEFIKEAGGSDIRAFVVGNRVVAAMERTAAPGEFRSNIHRGGTSRKIRLTPEERAAARRAAKILGLNVAGVDLMRSNHGPVVLEVNSSPGLEGIEGASGVDVAGKIVEFIEKNHTNGRQRSRGARG